MRPLTCQGAGGGSVPSPTIRKTLVCNDLRFSYWRRGESGPPALVPPAGWGKANAGVTADTLIEVVRLLETLGGNATVTMPDGRRVAVTLSPSKTDPARQSQP